MRKSILWFFMPLFCLCACVAEKKGSIVADTLEHGVLQQASENLTKKPITITSFIAERSQGDKHDFYSEGDYWWPDSTNLSGPYVRRDGQTNPDNFVAHRKAMIEFSSVVGNLTSAYLLTKDRKYADAVIAHVRAWFMDKETYMRPALLYAQAIKGVVTGRGIGIIDTVHLMEVAQSLYKLEEEDVLPEDVVEGTKKWFSDYLKWISTHPYGQDEMKAKNNHGTCWVMQAAVFAKYVGDETILSYCRTRYTNDLLPRQMADDGSFPLELARTKPYGYSLFNLDAMVTICQTLSTSEDNLWRYETSDGKSIGKGIDFIYPYVVDKNSWPYAHDVMYWEEWPVAHPFLIFGGVNLNNSDWVATWAKLDHFPQVDEVVRNLPVRNPLIWL